ncbi:HAD-like domain-containing protein [Geopyxis carbonaria]|nr:HAD-like domain-containing protein [Geopyxis carbonaria]
MYSRSLLVTFDAFGTLFSPRWPIAVQYAKIAKTHGIFVLPKEVEETFKPAFKIMSEEYPNYGKNRGMDAPTWWTQVIYRTFTPHMRNTPLPAGLAPELLRRFTSDEAYILHGCIPGLLTCLRRRPRTAIGIISNSDPRVPEILRSLHIDHLFDFVTLSYEVGYEKPDRRIFDAASRAGERVVKLNPWDKWEDRLHIGDDIVKDVRGARNAGWRGLLWDNLAESQSEDLYDSFKIGELQVPGLFKDTLPDLPKKETKEET